MSCSLVYRLFFEMLAPLLIGFRTERCPISVKLDATETRHGNGVHNWHNARNKHSGVEGLPFFGSDTVSVHTNLFHTCVCVLCVHLPFLSHAHQLMSV